MPLLKQFLQVQPMLREAARRRRLAEYYAHQAGGSGSELGKWRPCRSFHDGLKKCLHVVTGYSLCHTWIDVQGDEAVSRVLGIRECHAHINALHYGGQLDYLHDD